MRIVIQCAASKNSDAGYMQDVNGKKIVFVAHPDLTTSSSDFNYQRPDDLDKNGVTWRTRLLRYNRKGKNHYGLLPTYKLYSNYIYERLIDKFVLHNVFILSAGWGVNFC